LKTGDPIKQTQCWLDQFIIEHTICPFAQKERDADRIRFVVDESSNIEQTLEYLIQECGYLEQTSEIETTLFIIPRHCQTFEDYLWFLDLANDLLVAEGYEGVFQLASFHPDYLFADSSEDDPANYTNRSPYPMLHIIREESLEKALQHYPAPELIPERNIEYCRKMGLEKMQQILNNCRK
jgi:hypothetical protein